MASKEDWQNAVRTLLSVDRYPSPKVVTTLLRTLGHTEVKVTNNLNGRQCSYRDEVLDAFIKEHPEHPISLRRERLRVHT